MASTPLTMCAQYASKPADPGNRQPTPMIARGVAAGSAGFKPGILSKGLTTEAQRTQRKREQKGLKEGFRSPAPSSPHLFSVSPVPLWLVPLLLVVPASAGGGRGRRGSGGGPGGGGR